MQKVFLVLSIIQLPVIYIYSTGTSFKENADNFLGGYDQLMLGNLGYSSVNCDSTPFEVGYLGFQCNYGTVGKIYDFGLHERKDIDTYEMCVNDEKMKDCRPDNPMFIHALN